MGKLEARLEKIYSRYNRRVFVSPDPLQFLYDYDSVADREVVGLVASALAYGRVAMILKNAGFVLEKMGRSPSDYLCSSTEDGISCTFEGFRHRFTDGRDIASLLVAIKRCLEAHGSLEACFASHLVSRGGDCVGAMSGFVNELCAMAGIEKSYLLPDPARGSACKRMFLFLRWMTRKDDVDPGGWNCMSPADLLVPLDTHMHNISVMLGFTSRKQANLKAAREITGHFAAIAPDDPVKYDFALTRFGIREESGIMDILMGSDNGSHAA